MKKFLALLAIVFLGVWCYRSCIHKKTDATDDVTVLKQVRVTALSANLRTGPGTNYDYATVSADGTGGTWKLKRGTVLDVISETVDWYEVRPVGNTRTAYIKKSLCADLDKAQSKASRKTQKEQSDASPQNASKNRSETSSANQDDGVVEEVTKGKPHEDDVIF